MTAKETIRRMLDTYPVKGTDKRMVNAGETAVETAMIEFAREKVKEALQIATKQARMNCHEMTSGGEVSQVHEHRIGIDEYYGYEGYNEDHIRVTIQEESILNAYLLENIK